MRSTSKEFRRALFEDKRNYLVWADITPVGGSTLQLTNDQIWSAGLSLDDAVSDDSRFEALGATVVNQALLTLDNSDERFNAYDFSFAKVVIYVGMKFSSRTEKIQKGVYLVDEATYTGALIHLSCLDYMSKFDEPYQTTLHYPASLRNIVSDCCTKCGVTLNSYSFPHNDYVVPTKPDEDGITFREVIGWAATLAGCFARCDYQGRLELKWFDQETLEKPATDLDGGQFDQTTSSYYKTGDTADGGAFNPWAEGSAYEGGAFQEERAIHYLNVLYSQDISIDDVIFTGIKIWNQEENEDGKTEDKLYLFGQKGYCIEIKENPFINSVNVSEIGTWLAAQLVGLTFRKANIQHANNPAIEAGDIALIWDRKGREYPILITRTCFEIGRPQTTVCAAETPSRNSATRYSAATKAYVDARKLIEKEMTQREQQLANLAEKLASHSGLYSTVETQENGGKIYYLHDMPDLADSSIIWKMTAEAWGVSTNGGKTWNGGMTVDGDTVVRLLTAEGINCNDIEIRGKLQDAKGNNYWDLSTGEFKLSASCKVGNQTLAQYIDDNSDMTKMEIFNKLTDNGATQGIYMNNSKLYLNGTYLATGTITSQNGNTSWNLNDGTFTMKKGSITIGSRFTVDTSGNLSCTNASIKGSIKCGSDSGRWIELDSSGYLTGGYGSTTYSTVDCSASYVDENGTTSHRGYYVKAQCYVLYTSILGISRYYTSANSTRGYTGSCQITYNMNSNMTSCNTGTLEFVNGICTVCP